MQRRHEVSIRNVKDEVTADSASYMRLKTVSVSFKASPASLRYLFSYLILD